MEGFAALAGESLIVWVMCDTRKGVHLNQAEKECVPVNSLYVTTVLVCAHMAVEAPDQYVAAAKRNLHDHPAIVRMWARNNIIRRRAGLRAHRLNPELVKAAQFHAVYMARTGDFDHYSNYGPSGRAARYGYRGGVRENIAMGQGNIESAFNAWVNSGGHWANLSSGTMDAGFGYAVSARGTPYWVAVYANPSSPPPSQTVRAQN